ncbi:hypothetical protein [Chlorobium phaeovibrioides]|uniref:Uncharacterized protein n=1 Tax=Chlorobium phaeovibrioides TaxID=1094 RepID=A0ABW9USN3_CHLPH|nr:hypothetical protein [Chlorobium phaeovibrioides]MWV55277.1 hypothetical protein [Chlorobium phaeovibrioides]
MNSPCSQLRGYKRVTARIVAFALLLSGSPALLRASTTPEELSRSIRNEALTGYADGRETPAILQNSIVTGAFSSVRSAAESGTDPVLPTAAGVLPAVPLTLADGRLTASVAPASSSMAYSGDDQRFNINLGMGYYDPERGDGGIMGSGGLATMIGCQIAVGTSAVVYDIKRDVIANTIWQVPNSGLRFKLSGGYMWGDQAFEFASGNHQIGLEQYSYGLNTTWIIPKDGEESSLHSIGASVWGARANQVTHPDAVYFMRETASDYLFYRDPLLLSEGRLIGFSGDMQLALWENFVTKGSLGYERLKYPFADGTADIENALYSDLSFFWEPIQSMTVGAGWKNGVGEDRFSTSLESGHFTLSGWYSKGQAGLQDDKGAMLTYSLFTQKAPKGTTLARRMQPSRTTGASALLGEALERPVYMPSTFLAKVDLTAVTLESTVSKDLGTGATVDADGDIIVTVGAGAATIKSAKKDNADYTYTGIMEIVAGNLVIHSKLLAEGAATYVIVVTDTASADFNVTMVTE